MPLSNYLPSSRLIQPGVCTSTTRPASPYEGQAIYETDTDKMYIWNGSAWRYMATPQTTEIGAYTDYASSVTFSGFTKGNATVVARYAIAGKMTHYWGYVILGSTSSVSGPLDVALPTTCKGGILTHNSACSFYNNATLFWGMVLNISTTSIRLVAMNASGTYTSNSDISSTVPFTWANGHYFFWNHTYETE